MSDDLRLADKPNLNEIGVAGTKRSAGQVFEEKLSQLTGLNAYTTWQSMRHDSTCAAVYKAIELPIRSARWFVEPASDDPKDIEKADFIHDNLWNFGSQSMDDVLRLALQMIPFGFSWMEICYKNMDEGQWAGKVGWDKFAWRSQASKWRWNIEDVDGREELVSVTQLAAPFYRQVDIPRNKLLIFSNDQEGTNYDGWSMYRPAYKNWYYRETLYKIQAIGLERSYMGIPKIHLPGTFSDELKAIALNIVQNLRNDETSGVTLPENMTMEMMYSQLNHAAMSDAINHHTNQIAMSCLASFLTLGTQNVGSYALSNDQSDLFLMAINAKANYIAQTINLAPGVQQLIDFNFADATSQNTPRLVHGDTGQKDLDKLGRFFQAAGQFGFLTPDAATESKLRELLDLPDRDDTITDRSLADLIQQTFPNESVSGRKYAPTKPPIQVEHAQQVFAETMARKPMEHTGAITPEVRQRLNMTEMYMDAVEDMNREAGKAPDRPSIRAAKMVRPYVLSESPRAVINKVNKMAKDGDLKPIKNPVSPKLTPEVRAHADTITTFFKERGKKVSK